MKIKIKLFKIEFRKKQNIKKANLKLVIINWHTNIVDDALLKGHFMLLTLKHLRVSKMSYFKLNIFKQIFLFFENFSYRFYKQFL